MGPYLGSAVMLFLGVALLLGADTIRRWNARIVSFVARRIGFDPHESDRFGGFIGLDRSWRARGMGAILVAGGLYTLIGSLAGWL